ncbi:hypothetical protein WOLCODRAFT_156398 [Wolfiporia cocos MD-104 SS10]|uniref:DUF7330 domain-containing protein n=1 Tax=Wolfiporia cocos (strain MD-104) TaxID=742152 RepID=A0A2H3JAC8_WOLCO|nr:hypothetical protein WOLCODRAFT_156398 [Wolfiporia cocos MD-104 SS10]
MLPRFSQQFGDLEGDVFFDSLALKSTLSTVEVKSVSAHHTEVAITSGRIEGDFRTSGSLSLINSNDPIKSNGTAVSLSMKSSDGPITAGISLFSPAHSPGGAFNISARTSNSDTDIHLDESPLDARLNLYARSNNAPATVSMSREFEGSFRLRTTNARIAVPFNNSAEDPSGGNQLRNLDIERNLLSTEGIVSWNASHHGNGYVFVQTSNAPLRSRVRSSNYKLDDGKDSSEPS